MPRLSPAVPRCLCRARRPPASSVAAGLSRTPTAHMSSCQCRLHRRCGWRCWGTTRAEMLRWELRTSAVPSSRCPGLAAPFPRQPATGCKPPGAAGGSWAMCTRVRAAAPVVVTGMARGPVAQPALCQGQSHLLCCHQNTLVHAGQPVALALVLSGCSSLHRGGTRWDPVSCWEAAAAGTGCVAVLVHVNTSQPGRCCCSHPGWGDLSPLGCPGPGATLLPGARPARGLLPCTQPQPTAWALGSIATHRRHPWAQSHVLGALWAPRAADMAEHPQEMRTRRARGAGPGGVSGGSCPGANTNQPFLLPHAGSGSWAGSSGFGAIWARSWA